MNILQKILFAAVVSVGITSGLMMAVFFLDITLCEGKCLAPQADIEEAQRTIIYLTDDQDAKRM